MALFWCFPDSMFYRLISRKLLDNSSSLWFKLIMCIVFIMTFVFLEDVCNGKAQTQLFR